MGDPLFTKQFFQGKSRNQCLPQHLHTGDPHSGKDTLTTSWRKIKTGHTRSHRSSEHHGQHRQHPLTHEEDNSIKITICRKPTHTWTRTSSEHHRTEQETGQHRNSRQGQDEEEHIQHAPLPT